MGIRDRIAGCIRPYGRPSPALIAALAVLVIAGCGSDQPETTTETKAPDQGRVRLQKIGDFAQPVFVAQPPGSDDLYVVEKPGLIQLLREGEQTTALDISEEVSDNSEQGLLSIAFAPDAASSGLLYAYFTDAAGDQRVVEYKLAEDGTIDPKSRRDVIRMDDFAPNHNGGLVMFGPDDLLYIGTGDGGLADDPRRNGQSLNTTLGKILRIDPRPSGGRPYSIPADNPFTDQAAARGEIYSYGLRNPWRFSFDREGGAIAIGDVGQDSLEEVDYLPLAKASGANFGWSAFEGEERFNDDQQAPGHVPPILTYGREGGCSITGGYVVRDPELPSLQGRYLYGDFCAGELRSLEPAENGARDDRPLGLQVPNLSSFAEDNDGHIYATSLDGSVFQLAP